MSRLMKGYASAYSAHQVQPRRVRRFQKRSLQVNFNGAIEPDRTIETVTWECTSPWATYIASPSISSDQKSVAVDVSFNYAGCGFIKATVILDDTSSQNYEFQFDVTDAPLYPSTVYPMITGPFSVTANAP